MLLVWAGCSAKLSSDMSVNGEKATLTECRNGSVYGYRGVELTADNGTQLRIAATMTGEAEVAVVTKGSDKGVRLGTCGTLQITDQNSTINSVKNVEGAATLNCNSAGFALKGNASFSNCH
jgi:hypothetical protein